MANDDKKFTIVGLGEVLWDIYQENRHIGGAPTNLAVHAGQLGDVGIVVSRVGDDGLGRELVRALEQRNIPTEFIQVDKKKGTGTVLVSIDVKGVPSFRCSEDVAFDYLEFNPQLAELAANVDAIVFGTLAQRSAKSRATIQKLLRAANHAIKVLDVNSRAPESELWNILPASLDLADIVKMSSEEMALLRRLLRRDGDSTNVFVHYLMERFSLSLIALTQGDAGCELFNGRESHRINGLPVTVVDTTGAGDAFAAGMVHKFLRGDSLREIAEFSNLMGAYLCTQPGATPFFTMQEIEEFGRTFES